MVVHLVETRLVGWGLCIYFCTVLSSIIIMEY